MDDKISNSSKPSWLKRAFKGAVGVLKELTVHSVIHFTLWGSIFASNFAAFLSPIFNPLGDGVTFIAEQVGLDHIFTQAAGDRGALAAGSDAEISRIPELKL